MALSAYFADTLGVKKLHKLLYYCQGHHLATFDEPLFIESISAWDMGPVVGQLWKSEKDNGIAIEDAVLDEAVLNTVGYVVSRYGALTGNDLERLTHSEDPWIDRFQEGQGRNHSHSKRHDSRILPGKRGRRRGSGDTTGSV